MQRLSLTLILVLTSCTDKGGSTDTTPTTGGASSCAAALTKAACDLVPPDPVDLQPCLWVPIYNLEKVGDTCNFAPAGGQCESWYGSDTECGSQQAQCGSEVHMGMGESGLQIARVDGCAYTLHGSFELVDCAMNPDPNMEPTEALVCECGCADNYPE